MKQNSLAEYISKYFSSYLLDERGVTRSTIISYKNIMVQFLKYMNKTYNLNIDRIKLKDITFDKVKAYLQYLEKEKKVKTVTRNLHLSMLHSFFIYVQFEDVENSFEIQKILSIKMKKTFPTTINYLSIDAIKKILAKPDINTSIGRRNLAMLALLYDSGCRVQELIDLNVSSISFISPPTLKIIGKGRKIRMIPLIDKQIEIIKNYMKEYKLMNLERANEPLFFNSRGERFTRQNIAYILIKYANMVRKECPELIPEKISPHIFRHSKAMHLLQAGVNIVYIRDFMGHVSINTTEIYAKADSKMKREAIENAYVKLTDDKVPKWENNENLLSWLENL
jgi:integrase/recombinase XerD